MEIVEIGHCTPVSDLFSGRLGYWKTDLTPGFFHRVFFHRVFFGSMRRSMGPKRATGLAAETPAPTISTGLVVG
jgi:hypothetical protein